MKSKLAVFDFDYTIKQPKKGIHLGLSHFFPGGDFPEELHQIRKEKGWDCFVNAVYNKVNELGLTKEQLHDGFANNNGVILDGMDQVIKTLYQTGHDLIIVSDSHRVNIEDFLKKYLIFDMFEEIFCKPAIITHEGKISTSAIPPEWGGPCPYGGRNLCKGSAMKYFAKTRDYKEIKYVGDGKNDLCPVLSLTEHDKVYPRRNFSLFNLLSSGEHEVKAQIFPWTTGSDIYSYISDDKKAPS